MAARQVASESSEEEYFSVEAHGYGGAETSDSEAETASMAPPRHPVASMQGAFEESIYESSEPNQPKSKDGTAESRRQRMLEVKHYDDAWTTRWKQNPGARHHPLAKLMAQIVFGMHLLQQQAAKSDEEVVKILQTHVDEVDNFLEKTTDDFDLAIKDIAERIHFLKLPMAHPDVFSKMLEEKQFRTQLMDGNEKIENIVERTSRAMNAALLDITKGKAATKELGHYLNAIADEWPGEKHDLEAVLTAMRGNEQGWKHCFKDLQKKSDELRDNLDQLSTVIREMGRMAAAASRRTRAHGRAVSASQSTMSAIPRSKFSSDSQSQSQRPNAMSVDKPLPKAPVHAGGPVELEAHPVPIERRYEQPRPTPISPTRAEKARAPRSSTVPPRPTTSSSAMTPREARVMGRNDTTDLVDFLREKRELSPLRSNPPDGAADQKRSAGNPKRQSAIDVIEHAKALSRDESGRPKTSDGASTVPYKRRGSEPPRMESQPQPHRVGIERNKHGPPPSGGRDSSLGPRFMRRLSFRSRTKSPPANRETPQPPRPASQSRRPSHSGSTSALPYTLTTSAQRKASQQDLNPQSATAVEASIQRAASPALEGSTNTNTNTTTTAQQTQAPPQTQPTNDAPSSPSPASLTTRATTPTPSTSNLSPTVKSDSTRSTEKPSSPTLRRPGLASNASVNGSLSARANGNGNASVNGSVKGNGSITGSKGGSPAKSSVDGAAGEKKRSRGLSLRRFFGSSSSKAPKERVPRAAMTYGDLA